MDLLLCTIQKGYLLIIGLDGTSILMNKSDPVTMSWSIKVGAMIKGRLIGKTWK